MSRQTENLSQREYIAKTIAFEQDIVRSSEIQVRKKNLFLMLILLVDLSTVLEITKK